MLNVAFYKSPIGILKITSSDYSLKKIELVKRMEDFDASPFNYRVIQNLEEYFLGKLNTFNIKIEFPGNSVFEKRVYDNLQHVCTAPTAGPVCAGRVCQAAHAGARGERGEGGSPGGSVQQPCQVGAHRTPVLCCPPHPASQHGHQFNRCLVGGWVL